MACCNKPTNEREFRPNYTFKPLTEKFYARHDNTSLISTGLTRFPYFEDEIEKRLNYDARDCYLAPITENQTYGWLERLGPRFENYTALDHDIFVHHIAFDEVMNVEKKIAIDVHREQLLNKL